MWALVAVLAVIILLGIIPIRFSVEYGEDGFFACLRVLFVKIKLPGKTKGSVHEKKKEAKQKEKKPGSIKALTSAIKPAFKTLGKLTRMFCVRKLVAKLTLASDNAFSTAMMYGGTAAGISSIFPFIDNNIKIKKKNIYVTADFESSETVVYLFADISILIWQVIVLAIYFMYNYIKRVRIKEKKGLKKNG